jgi:phosphoribosylanthranilate isomerase
VFLKICGITKLGDALHAIENGATALGFVLWPRSPRYVAPEAVSEILTALPASVMTVGVFVNEQAEEVARVMSQTKLTAVQLHGDEPLSYAALLHWPVLRSITLQTAHRVCLTWPASTTLLLDAADPQRRGGTGEQVDWWAAAQLARTRRVVLAGGLTPDNVAAAISVVRPYGVDVSSGVEDEPGVKNAKKVARFLTLARKAATDVSQAMEK